MPKFTQKLYAFVYSCLIDFPESNIDYVTVTTKSFFQNVDRIITVKTDQQNWRLRENKTEFVCLAHNVFGFDLFFLMQDFGATTWNTKDFNVDGSGLTRINFANIALSTNFINALKYYQKTLAQLTKTPNEAEKDAIKKLTRQLLVRYDYFGLI